MARHRVALILVVLALTVPAAAQEKADLLLFNGKVLTVDPAFSVKSAVAVRDGKILAVGGDELTKRYAAPTRVDLHGRVLMPGKLADMIVLDRDILTVPDEQILTLQVERTYLGGKLVYERKGRS
jgi:predicted amidohydrolase YtcJ